MTQSSGISDAPGTLRRPYTSPALVNFGALSVLTAGGSKNASENSFINQMLCGNVPTRKCG